MPKKYRAGPKPIQTPIPSHPSAGRNHDWSIKATFHLTICVGNVQQAKFKGIITIMGVAGGLSLTGKTMSVFLIFRQGKVTGISKIVE